MPAFNSADFIGAAIESLVEQSFEDWELIVVNDGSTDNTLNLLKEFADRDSRIRWLTQENRGPSAASNKGYSMARGRYVKFFDSDDILGQGLLHAQYESIRGSDSIVVNGPWRRFRQTPQDMAVAPSQVWKDMAPLDWLLTACEDAEPMMQCGAWLIPRTVIDSAGPWNESLRLLNDFEFFVRVVLASSRVMFVSDGVLHYRSGMPNSVSQHQPIHALDSYWNSIRLGMERILAVTDDKRARQVAANVFSYFEWSVYPERRDLCLRAAASVQDTGCNPTIIPPGPAGFQILRRVLGWRAARRIQRLAERLGLNRASLRRRFARR